MFTYDKEAVENGTATNSGYALISSWDDFFLHTVQVEGATAENVSQKAYDYVASLKDTNVVNFAKKASDWVKSQKDFGASLKHEAIAAVNGNTYTATINNLSYGYYVVSPADGRHVAEREEQHPRETEPEEHLPDYPEDRSER